MKLQVNGEPMQLPDGLCLEALIRRLEMPAERVAAMINGEVVPRDVRDQRRLVESDTVELLTFAGGG